MMAEHELWTDLSRQMYRYSWKMLGKSEKNEKVENCFKNGSSVLKGGTSYRELTQIFALLGLVFC